MPGIAHIHSMKEWKAALAVAGDKVAVVDFFATWCPPCKAIAPLFAELAESHANLVFLKVDVDEAEVEDVVKAAGITCMPTFQASRFYKGGAKIDEFTGASQDKLRERCGKYNAAADAGKKPAAKKPAAKKPAAKKPAARTAKKPAAGVAKKPAAGKKRAAADNGADGDGEDAYVISGDAAKVLTEVLGDIAAEVKAMLAEDEEAPKAGGRRAGAKKPAAKKPAAKKPAATKKPAARKTAAKKPAAGAGGGRAAPRTRSRAAAA
ncbi:thioredoxin-like [Raphidocelis subcapitata]|uniref:Thioredoxin-like n=1 Tax=Raphidocelis subcapitata TaxID=307507 RepID=A0A2V0PEQ8_9CHLO|nr:thioredoxin-like [Raphidocelis subcapitata]|eukprot:GBF98316.1 thioredoxin-like [Raphidocelis subcapitata]